MRNSVSEARQNLSGERVHSGRGQALLEFALLLPLLMLFLFGVLDLGRAFFSIITISNAAREGARYATLHPADFPGVRAAAVNEALNSGIPVDPARVFIICEDLVAPTGCDRGVPIRVTVEMDFDLVMGIVIPSPITLSRSVEMIAQ